MNKKEQSRSYIKDQCEIVFNKNNNILLEMATGVGKTINAINLQHIMNSQKTFICVAEIAHVQNWKDEYVKHGYEELLKTTEIFCYASLKKYQKQSCELLILDEVHHAFTENRMEYLLSINKARTIGLSATLTDEDKYRFKETFGTFDLLEITMDQAIEMELLSKPQLKIISLELNETINSEMIIFKRGKPTEITYCEYIQKSHYILNKKRYYNIELHIACNQKQKYQYISEEYEHLKKTSYYSTASKFKWLNYGNVRKRFLSDCKTEIIQQICTQLSNERKRFICFCGSIEQTELIGGENCVHSKKDSSKIVSRFNKKDIDSIYAMKMLTEGMNLTDIHVAIISQLDGTERPFIQRTGRGLRAEFPVIYVLYIKGTKDEDYLLNVTNNIPSEYIIYL